MIRYDLSNKLIHWVRDINSNDAAFKEMPRNFPGAKDGKSGDKVYAEFVLRNIVRTGRIWGGWSVRGKGRTIYGMDRAVCMTEMPVPAFIEAATERKERGEAISPIALIFNKTAMHQLGARPAIYGLSATSYANVDAAGNRLLNAQDLPLVEQYRYIAYAPNIKGLDWSHEREWRYPCRGTALIGPASDEPGLNIFSGELFNAGVIVKTKKQALRVSRDILTQIDRGVIREGHFSFIIVSEENEGLGNIRDQIEVERIISNSAIDLGLPPEASEDQVQKSFQVLTNAVALLEDKAGKTELGPMGGCWLCLQDNAHPITRRMLKSGLAKINTNGFYLIDLPGLNKARSLRQRVAMVKRLCSSLKRTHGVTVSYFSTPGSDDFNARTYKTGFSTSQNFFNFNNDYTRFDLDFELDSRVVYVVPDEELLAGYCPD